MIADETLTEGVLHHILLALSQLAPAVVGVWRLIASAQLETTGYIRYLPNYDPFESGCHIVSHLSSKRLSHGCEFSVGFRVVFRVPIEHNPANATYHAGFPYFRVSTICSFTLNTLNPPPRPYKKFGLPRLAAQVIGVRQFIAGTRYSCVAPQSAN